MNQHAIFHIADTPWAYPRDDNHLTLCLRSAGDVTRVTVFYKDCYDWYDHPWQALDMTEFARSKLFRYWTADLALRRNRYRYCFELEGAHGETLAFDEGGLRPPGNLRAEAQAFQFPFIHAGAVYRGNEILAEAIVYQIFPDRFRNGDAGNDPPGTLPWGGIPQSVGSFGGDLKGITEKLGYIRDLGANLLYLTPVFCSASNHKYNIRDYYAIDPQFGTLAEAREMVRQAHALGLKVYFDAVFNHTGADFFAFADILQNQEKSPYLDWYHLDGLPVSLEEMNYFTFANGVGTMPKLRTENPAVREYFFNVGRYWIREIGIDGWRLDVCDEVDHAFWRDFRRACLEENPGAGLVGEIMHQAGSFLRGDELDSVMNYPFKYAMTEFFARRSLDVEGFMDCLTANRVSYQERVTRQLWNLLDSHDTPRFLTEALGQRDRLCLASAFQFLYIGVPYIYYGDEIGLDGGPDPWCRRPMPWGAADQDLELLAHFKAISALRRSSPAFSWGSFRELQRGEHCILFQRQAAGETFWCAFNNSDEEQAMPLQGAQTLAEVTPGSPSGKTVMESILLPPMTYRVFRVKEEQ